MASENPAVWEDNPMRSNRLWRSCLAGIAATCAAEPVVAATAAPTYPTKPIRALVREAA
jgi:hypothetical protein